MSDRAAVDGGLRGQRATTEDLKKARRAGGAGPAAPKVGWPRAEVIKVEIAGFEQLRYKGVPVIDLRTPGEWSHTGVIEGSPLLTFGDAGGRYDVDGWASRLAAIAAREEPIGLICRSGRRSSIATRILEREHGYEQVFDVVGGMERWIAEGRATVRP